MVWMCSRARWIFASELSQGALAMTIYPYSREARPTFNTMLLSGRNTRTVLKAYDVKDFSVTRSVIRLFKIIARTKLPRCSSALAVFFVSPSL
jgi:hypothetical protein